MDWCNKPCLFGLKSEHKVFRSFQFGFSLFIGTDKVFLDFKTGRGMSDTCDITKGWLLK